MITVNVQGISIEKEPAGVMAGLLWDLLNIIGNRYTFLVVDCGDDVEYKFNHKIVAYKKKKIGVFGVSKEEEYDSLIRSFSESAIDDFYIIINSHFNNIVSSCEKPGMFDDEEGFLIKALLLDYPQHVHIEENGLFIDFSMFKPVKFQLENAVKKYEAKLKKL